MNRRTHVSARRQAWHLATAAAVLLALVSVQLYLYSPWHRHPAGQSQYCRFNPVEQSGGLEASWQAVLPPPSVLHAVVADPALVLPAAPGIEHRQSRAPPV